MKLIVAGLIVFSFGVFGLFSEPRSSAVMSRSENLIAGAAVCLIGLGLFVLGLKRRAKKAGTRAPAGDVIETSELKSAPGEPLYFVQVRRSNAFSIPPACCACGSPPVKKITASGRELSGNRILSLEFPICGNCHRERYRGFKRVEAVRLSPDPIRKTIDFVFSSREYAEKFAEANGGNLFK